MIKDLSSTLPDAEGVAASFVRTANNGQAETSASDAPECVQPSDTLRLVRIPVASLALHPMAAEVPTGSEGEDASLLKSMQDRGFDPRYPLHVVRDPNNPDRYIILDGRRRYQTAQLIGLDSVPCIIVSPDVDQMKYMKDAAWNRRNIRTVETVLNLLDDKSQLQASAKQKQREGGKRKEKASQKSGKAVHVDREIAKRSGVSHDTVHRISFIKEHAPEMVGQLRAGTESVNKVYKDLKKSVDEAAKLKRRQDAIAALPAAKPVVGFENQIIPGDNVAELRKVPDGVVDCIVTSPPYYTGLVKYDVYETPQTYEEYLDNLKQVLTECYRVLRTGGRAFINLDNTTRNIKNLGKYDVCFDMKRLAYDLGFLFLADIIWYKQTTPSSGGRAGWGTYCSPLSPCVRNAHELVICLCKETRELKGDPTLIDTLPPEFTHATVSTWNYDAANKESAESNPSSFWYVQPVPGSSKHRSIHPCPFPPKLVELILYTWTYRGNLVLDPYNGSGTTCAVAKKLGRRYLGIDLSKDYCRQAQQLVDETQVAVI